MNLLACMAKTIRNCFVYVGLWILEILTSNEHEISYYQIYSISALL